MSTPFMSVRRKCESSFANKGYDKPIFFYVNEKIKITNGCQHAKYSLSGCVYPLPAGRDRFASCVCRHCTFDHLSEPECCQ